MEALSHNLSVYSFHLHRSDKSLHTLWSKRSKSNSKWEDRERPGVLYEWWLFTWKERKGKAMNTTYLSVIEDFYKTFTSCTILFSNNLSDNVSTCFYHLCFSMYHILFLPSTLCTGLWDVIAASLCSKFSHFHFWFPLIILCLPPSAVQARRFYIHKYLG